MFKSSDVFKRYRKATPYCDDLTNGSKDLPLAIMDATWENILTNLITN